jgi:hypothetical protein
VEMIPLHYPSKGISVDKQANDDVVHLCGFREANGLTDQAFNTRPQVRCVRSIFCVFRLPGLWTAASR